MPRPVRRVVLKEEYVALTGDTESAILLNQIDYWAKRTYDIDKYLAEEEARARHDAQPNQVYPYTHGWIYKSVKEWTIECMFSLKETMVRARLKSMIKAGWISERDNPYHPWDHKKQYRFNAVKVAEDLNKLGYTLEGWAFNREMNDDPGSGQKPDNACDDRIPLLEDRSSLDNCPSDQENLDITDSRFSRIESRKITDQFSVPDDRCPKSEEQYQRSYIENKNKDQQQPASCENKKDTLFNTNKCSIYCHADQQQRQKDNNVVVDCHTKNKKYTLSRQEHPDQKTNSTPLPDPSDEQLEAINNAIKRVSGGKIPASAARFLWQDGGGDLERILSALKAADVKKDVRNMMGWLRNAVIQGFVPLESAGEKRIKEKEEKYKDLYFS